MLVSDPRTWLAIQVSILLTDLYAAIHTETAQQSQWRL